MNVVPTNDQSNNVQTGQAEESITVPETASPTKFHDQETTIDVIANDSPSHTVSEPVPTDSVQPQISTGEQDNLLSEILPVTPVISRRSHVCRRKRRRLVTSESTAKVQRLN